MQDVEAGGGAASEAELSDSEEDFHSQVCITNTVSAQYEQHRDTSACAADLLALHLWHAMFASPTGTIHMHTMACCVAPLYISLHLLIACLQYRWLALHCRLTAGWH